jgi:hypothetical protein
MSALNFPTTFFLNLSQKIPISFFRQKKLKVSDENQTNQELPTASHVKSRQFPVCCMLIKVSRLIFDNCGLGAALKNRFIMMIIA